MGAAKLNAGDTERLTGQGFEPFLARAIWANELVGIMVVDGEGTVLAANAACDTLFGKEVRPGTRISSFLGIAFPEAGIGGTSAPRPGPSGGLGKPGEKDAGSAEPTLVDLYLPRNGAWPQNPSGAGGVLRPSGLRVTVEGRTLLMHELDLKGASDQTPRGAPRAFLIFDETDKVRLEEELKAAKLLNWQLEKIFDSSFDELYVTDGQGNTLKVSKGAYQRLYGCTPDEVIGKNVKDLEAMGRFRPSVFPRILEERRPITFMQHTSKGRQMLVTSTPIFDDAGNIVMVVSNSRDVTELINLREQLERTEEKIRKYEEEVAALRDELLRVDGIVAASPQMKNILHTVSKVAKTESTVLILGPSGVGKEVIAKTIHKLSPRAQGAFMKINCAAVPETLIEAELFGYERGAFTGARKEGKPGLIELAEGGTLFLDEIGELPLQLQAKLLDVLQDKKFVRVGGTKPVKVDARMIAATNRNLDEMVEKGAFRKDLYYRLMVIPIQVPPLKERPEDTYQLLRHFLKKFCDSLGVHKAFSPEALDVLLAYDWPGNVRELENLVERLVVTVDSPVIGLDVLPTNVLKATGHVPRNKTLKVAVVAAEETLLRDAARRYGSTRKIARALGISQSSVVRKLNKYGIKPGGIAVSPSLRSGKTRA